ncbi:MAG: ABC transporter permease [Sulfolobales archaeon]
MRNIDPVIYDFKRSLLKRSTLLILALAILMGIGLSYLLFGFLLQSTTLEDINVKAYMIATINKIYLAGTACNSKGEPLKDSIVKLYLGGSLVAEAKTDRNGFFSVENNYNLAQSNTTSTPIPQLVVSSGEKSVNATVSKMQPYMGSGGVLFVAEFSRESPYVNGLSLTSLINSTRSYIPPPDKYLSFIVLGREGDNLRVMILGLSLINGSFKPLDEPLYYSVANASVFIESTRNITSPLPLMSIEVVGLETLNASRVGELRFSSLGELKELVSIKAISVGGVATSDNVLILATPLDKDVYLFSAGPFSRYSYLDNLLITNLSSSAGIFFFMLSIVVYFLVNSLIAKPRSSGELEFILSKPLTRDDLYITRYLSILLTIIFMVAALLLVLNIFIYILVGATYEISIVIRLFLGITGSLVALLSLFYFIATSLRSGLYTGVAIALYVVLILLWDSIMFAIGIGVMRLQSFEEISRFTDETMYLNPRILVRYILDSLTSIVVMNYKPVLELPYVLISWALWTFAPFFAGLFRFRRINLSA